MSSAGLGGRSDADMMPEGAADETLSDVNEFGEGEPIGMIEVVEIETDSEGLEALGLEPTTPRFRWWYVPAAALPIAAGATAGAIWLAQRNRNQRGPVVMYRRLSRQGLGLLEQVRLRRRRTPWQRGLATVRESAVGLPEQASMLRDKSAAALAAIDMAALLEQTRDIWSNAADQMTSLWERNVPGGKKSARRARKASKKATAAMRAQAMQMRRQLIGLRRRGRVASRVARVAGRSFVVQSRINQWIGRQQARGALTTAGLKAMAPLASAARSTSIKAMAPLASAARSTSMSVRRTGRTVNSGFRQARAFGFGVLVAAMATYVRVWRARLNERELRETAGGRMVRDPSGPVEAGALLP